MKRKTKSLPVSPSIFLEAARILGEGEERYCCHAIASARFSITSGFAMWNREAAFGTEVLYLRAVCNKRGRFGAWYSDSLSGGYEFDDIRNHNARVIGLCLCALLAKEGFIPEGFNP